MPPRSGDADVEEAALLGQRLRVGRGLADRQRALLQPGKEDGVPLEPLGAMERREGHAVAAGIGLVGVAAGELGEEVLDGGVRLIGLEGPRHPEQGRQRGVAVAGLGPGRRTGGISLVEAELPAPGIGDESREPALTGAAQGGARGTHVAAGEEADAADRERDLGRGQRGLERHELRVRPHEHRELGHRHAFHPQRLDARHDRGDLGVAIGVGKQVRDRSFGSRCAQLATGDQAVGQRDHLRRAAVVRAQANDGRIGVSVRKGGQVLRTGAGEGVDRLVGVADHAQVAPVAEPQPEQVLLEPVRVLVLVDAEPAVAPMDERERVRIGLVQLDRQGQHVLEVDPVRPLLGRLVSAPEVR